MAAASELGLPDDCWESIFKFLIDDDGIDDDGNNHRYLESLSILSKQFLSITNRLRFSLIIIDPTLRFLPHLLTRFPNLTSLNLTRFEGDLNALLTLISTFPLRLKSLKLSNHSKFPENGLRAFSKKITSLTSLTCSNLQNKHLILISDCFPLLEELDISYPKRTLAVVLKAKYFELPKLRKVNLSGYSHINASASFILELCKNCEFLEEIVMLKYSFLNGNSIAPAIRERPGLRAISFSDLLLCDDDILIDSLLSLKGLTCLNLTYVRISNELLSLIAEKALPLRRLILQDLFGYNYVGLFNLLSKCKQIQYLDLQRAKFLKDHDVFELSSFLGDLLYINISKCWSLTSFALFALLKNCAKLNEVRMEDTNIGNMSAVNYYELKVRGMNMSAVNHLSVVYPHLKSLRLAHNTCLGDKDINMFASVFPNLQLLDLSFSDDISEDGIGQVLRKCSKISDLNLANCSGLKLFKTDIEIFMLEALNLSHTRVDDETLHVISTSCFRLQQLDLGHCYDVTEKGVMQVLENCAQLREINLKDCRKVSVDAVDSMVLRRPSLRKITTPPGFCCSDSKRELFLRLGCLVC